LESGFSVVGPFLDPVPNAESPPWALDFAILYPDKMYIRIYEYYRPLPRSAGGGGCLQYFAYHYGPYRNGFDRNGFPFQIDEVELRIDVDEWHKRHAHYGSENHIPEARLSGLDFNAIDPFQFIQAVDEYRKGRGTHLTQEKLDFVLSNKALSDSRGLRTSAIYLC